MASIVVELKGPSGNIFAVLGMAKRELENEGKKAEASQMFKRVTSQKSYEAALKVVEEYVEVEYV